MIYKLEIALSDDATPKDIAASLDKAASQLRGLPSIDGAVNTEEYWAMRIGRPVGASFELLHGVEKATE